MPKSPPTTPALVRTFLAAQNDPLEFATLFDDIPGVECFVKDTKGHRVQVSNGIWKRLGLSCAADMIGKRDHDLFPPHIADQYIRSDQEVLSTGQPQIGLIEIWINEQGTFEWFIINKYPVRGKDGSIIGIMGTLRESQSLQKSLAPHSPLGKVADRIRTHFHEPSSVASLSRIAGLSERQLRRRFQQEFGIGIHAFLLKARIHAAADRLVRRDSSIADIALEVGFCDQSAFTRAFRERMGLTPREYRIRYKASANKVL